jgi:small-conductance mechanosensitive channel
VLREESRYEIRSADRGRRVAARAHIGLSVCSTISFRGRGCRLQGLVLALLIAAGSARAAASDPESDPPAAKQASVTAAAIPAAKIAEGIEQCRERLRDTEDLLANDPRAEAVQDGLPDAQKKLASLSRHSWSVISSQSPSGFLLDIEDQWSSWKERLQTWQRTLADLVAELDTALTKLANLRQQWEDTRNSAAAQQLPAPLTDSVERALAAIRATEAKANARRDELLALQGKVAETQDWVDAEISALELQRADQRKQLWERQSPALWKAFAEPSAASVGAQARQAFLNTARSIVQFSRDSGVQLAVFGLLLLLMVAALLWLRTRVSLGSDADAAPALRIFSRPLSAAFLIALLLMALVATRPTVEVRRLIALLAALPILRLLPGTLFGRTRLVMLALTAAYVLSQVIDLTAGMTLLERLVLLGEALLGIVVLVQIIATERRSRAPAIAAAIGLPVLVIALGANVWGSVSLARMLTHGTIYSAYLAAIFAATVLLLDGILAAVERAGAADSIRIVQNHGRWLRQQLGWIVRVVMTVWWVSLTLELFQLRGGVVTAATNFLTARWSIGSVALSIGGVLRFGVTLWVAILLSRAAAFILAEEVLPRMRLRPGVPDAIATGVRYAVVAGGFLLAVTAAGVEFAQIALLAGALSVGLGFGLQNVVNNFVSGLILLFERPIKMGDVVEVGPTLGNVRRIGIRSSTIHTSDGADVIVPNGDLISQRLVNWTYTDQRRRIDLPVSITAAADPAVLADLLVRVAAAHPAVLAVPAPAALLTAFAENKLDFSLRFWTERFEVSSRVRSEVAVSVRAALQKAGYLGPAPAATDDAETAAAD